MFHDPSVHHSDYILRRAQSPIDSDLPHVHTIHRAHLEYFIFHASRFTTYAPYFTLPHKGRSTYRALVHDQTDVLVYSMRSGTTCVSRSVSAHNRAFSPQLSSHFSSFPHFSLEPVCSTAFRVPFFFSAPCVCVESPCTLIRIAPCAMFVFPRAFVIPTIS